MAILPRQTPSSTSDGLPCVFVATLGERYQAITFALELLLESKHYAEIVIIHTALRGDIAAAAANLRRFLEDVEQEHAIPFRFEEIAARNGRPMYDIDDQISGEDYLLNVAEILLQFAPATNPAEVDLMIAGGRKEMSIFAAVAGYLALGVRCRVWSIHAAKELIHNRQTRIPPGQRQAVKLIGLPSLSAQAVQGLITAEGYERLSRLLDRRTDLRSQFLKQLDHAKQARRAVDYIGHHPLATDEEIAAAMGKASTKTISNQLTLVYQVMQDVIGPIPEEKRRIALVLLLHGWWTPSEAAVT